jgi:predicted ArsR family transcriptional regulator
MNTPPESDEFDDINEAVGDEWEAETTPYERVREVARHVYTPKSAGAIAEDARTSPKTARKHLTALASEGFVATEPGDNGGTKFRRSPESLVVEQTADILDEMTTDELVDHIAAMRQELADLRTEYGAESPEELTVDLTNETLSGTDAPAEIDREALQRWQTTRRNLAFANAALSVANAERFVDQGSDAPAGTVVSR